ncbi:MAG TPA: T9SS type A sorting domain-containing protein [Saprospiraceae bacterium]|nr:T9SS type A sorting domain-containing protein [Saprospiraceae bacterium]
MKTLFLFVLLASYWYMGNGQVPTDVVLPPNDKEAMITIGSGDYWIGGDENSITNEDYKFSADPGRVKPFKIYPNPTTGIIHIEGLPKTDHAIWVMQLIDMDGRLIYNTKFDPVDRSINLPEVSRGNYVIKLVWQDNVYAYRITLF